MVALYAPLKLVAAVSGYFLTTGNQKSHDREIQRQLIGGVRN